MTRSIATATAIVALSGTGGCGGAATQGDGQAVTRLGVAYGETPLAFEANRGQSDPRVEFISRGAGYGLYLTARDVVLALGRPSRAAVLRMKVVGASSRARPRGRDPLAGQVNYLHGNDPARWRTGVPAYGRVVYEDVRPSVDLILQGNQRALEYDFVVAPGADPRAIALDVGGAKGISISKRGELVISTAAGKLRQRAPFVYQDFGGSRHRVAGGFTLERGRVGFDVGAYDRARPLVIDPVLEYSTFLGGATSYDAGEGIAVDAAGAAYVTGNTFSADFPVTAGALDTTPGPVAVCAPAQDPAFAPPPADQCVSDAFVSKLRPDGKALVYSTFLGGSRSDRGEDVAVDASGAAYVSGGTDSADFPTTPGAPDSTAAGTSRTIGAGLIVLGEGFLAKLGPDGSSLVYSTLLGGADADEAMGVEVASSGAAYVAGHTFSADFPTTPAAMDRVLNTPAAPPGAASDAFVAEVDPSGHSLSYSTFLGGRRIEFGMNLAIDEAGSAYVTGDSTSSDFPTTPGAVQTTGHVHTTGDGAALEQFGDADAYVVKLVPDGSRAAYSTLVGGNGHEHGHGIAVRDGEAYVTGHTLSRDFPTTGGAFDRSSAATGAASDGWVARLSAGGGSLLYSTYIGGTDDDWGFDIALDPSGAAHVAGMTASADFPTTPDALDATYAGPGAPFYDATLVKLTTDGSKLLCSTYLGGSGPDVARAIALDDTGSAYLAGFTFSPDLPTTAGAPGPLFKGPPTYADAFAAKVTGLPDQPAAALRAGATTPRGSGP